MKQSNNNAVDVLLRSLARRERDESRAGESGALTDGRSRSRVASDHLDADELNLYAEGVLPPHARARYAEHLADCGSCRGIVVGLARSAGTSARYETVNQQSGLGFWYRFAALFSLPVLRYALPALVLTGLIAVALVAWREQKRNGLVARNQQVESPAVVTERQQAESAEISPGLTSGPGNASPSAILQKKDGASASTASNEVKNNPGEVSGLLAKTSDTITDAKPGAAPAAKDAQEYPEAASVTTSQKVFAPEPAPPKPVVTGADLKSSARKEDVLERDAQRHQEEGYKLQAKDDSPTHGPARSRVAPSGGSAGRRDLDLEAENRVSSAKLKRESGDEVETRTVSGRRFRRQGNVWIDTAYESSRRTTNVARGSEQFRSLLADEPGLRAIVQQLGGEVVVVWKNRQYRIR